MVKTTYYFDNGQIQQEGFLKWKIGRKWVSYDVDGNRKSIGEYEKGIKNGEMVFWNNVTLSRSGLLK